MEKLLSLGFIESAYIELNGDLPLIRIINNEHSRNILYAFVVVIGEDSSQWMVRYIGHSRKTLRNRMYGYQLGGGVAVNNRIHNELKDRCRNGERMVVYCLPDIFSMSMHGLHIDVSAGLEYALIDYYRMHNQEMNHPPLQNIAGNSGYQTQNTIDLARIEHAEVVEEEGLYVQEPINLPAYEVLDQFTQNLATTYWRDPFINIPRRLSQYFGNHNETTSLTIAQNGQILRQFTLQINRQAVSNGSPRFYIPGQDGNWFQNWKHENFEFNADLIIKIIGHNELLINIPQN